MKEKELKEKEVKGRGKRSEKKEKKEDRVIISTPSHSKIFLEI